MHNPHLEFLESSKHNHAKMTERKIYFQPLGIRSKLFSVQLDHPVYNPDIKNFSSWWITLTASCTPVDQIRFQKQIFSIIF